MLTNLYIYNCINIKKYELKTHLLYTNKNLTF